MISKEVLVRAKFYQPGSKKYKFYAGNDGYLKYMKDRELNSPEGIPKSNYFSYMEGRPGSAGIWSNLKKIEPVPKKSLVWDVIVSFERKYAVENNLHVQEGTKRVIKANLDNFLVENGIDPDNVQVICSHHSNTDNPHVHMRINLRRPDVKNPDTGEMEFRRRGKFTARSLSNFKGNILEYQHNQGKILWDENTKLKNEAIIEVRSMMEKEYLKKLDIIRSTKILLNKNKTKRTSFNSLSSDIQFQIKEKFDEFTKYSPKLKSLREEIDKWYDSHRVKGPNNKSYQSKLDFYQKQTNDMLLNVFIKEVKSAKISSVKIATNPDIQRKHKKINLSRRANNDKALLRLSENAAHELEIYVNSLEAELSKIAWDFEKGLEENGRN